MLVFSFVSCESVVKLMASAKVREDSASTNSSTDVGNPTNEKTDDHIPVFLGVALAASCY